MGTPTLDQIIEAKAAEHGTFAIAYALLQVAAELSHIADSIDDAGAAVAAGLTNVLVAGTATSGTPKP